MVRKSLRLRVKSSKLMRNGRNLVLCALKYHHRGAGGQRGTKVAKCARDEACRRVRAEGVDVYRAEVVEERVDAKVLEEINEEHRTEVAQGVVLTVDPRARLAADSALEAVFRERRAVLGK
eukprot:scaffold28117_cov64-Phaeocystis_antarctica.AAC.4